MFRKDVVNNLKKVLGISSFEKSNKIKDIVNTVHAHPTYPEAWNESALIANKTPLHII